MSENEINAIIKTIENYSELSKIDLSSANQKVLRELIDFIYFLKKNVDLSIETKIVDVLGTMLFGEKSFEISYPMAVSISKIYELLLSRSPTHITLTVMNLFLSICTNKTSTNSQKETSIMIICMVIELKPKDCKGYVQDLLQLAIKFIRGYVLELKNLSIRLLALVYTEFHKIVGDSSIEILKLINKSSYDKNNSTRFYCSLFYQHILDPSNSPIGNRNINPHRIFISESEAKIFIPDLAYEATLLTFTKLLEDEDPLVQDSFSRNYALLMQMKISNYTRDKAEQKIDMARGTEDAITSPQPSRSNLSSNLKLKAQTITKFSLAKFSSTKKSNEAFDLKSVVEDLISKIKKSPDILRSGYISSLGYLISNKSKVLSDEELEWIIHQLVKLFNDPLILELSTEEQQIISVKVSNIFRKSIAQNISDAKLVESASYFVNLLQLSDVIPNELSESKEKSLELSNFGIQICLTELCYFVKQAKYSVLSISDDLIDLSKMFLDHPNFTIRTAASNLVLELFKISPFQLVNLVFDLFYKIQRLSDDILTFSSSDFDKPHAELDEEIESPTDITSQRRRKLLLFHGSTILLSIILKDFWDFAEDCSNTERLIHKVLDLGIKLLSQGNGISNQKKNRNLYCSLIRAGSILISSCIRLGYEMVRGAFDLLLDSLIKLFVSIDQDTDLKNTSPREDSISQNDEVIYEIMTLEAGLVCFSSLLIHCKESLYLEMDYIERIVECLEISLKISKSRFSNKFRLHFRYKSFLITLMDCFSLIPGQKNFASIQNRIYKDGIKMFFEFISSGYESSCIYELLPSDIYKPYNLYNQYDDFSHVINSMNHDDILHMRIDQHSNVQLRKEREAYLLIFKTEVHKYMKENLLQVFKSEDLEHQASGMDSKLFDSVIFLIAKMFFFQTNDYQEKLLDLCEHTIQQFVKQGKSIGLFASEEEKRAKERKKYLACKNIVSLLGMMVLSCPYNSVSSFSDSASNRIYSMFCQQIGTNYTDVRVASLFCLANLTTRVANKSYLLEFINKTRRDLIKFFEKKEGVIQEEFSDHFLFLDTIWSLTANIPEVRSLTRMTVFDSLRKTQSPISFRSKCLQALSSILKDIDIESEELLGFQTLTQFMNEIILIVQTQLASFLSSIKIDSILLSSMKVVSSMGFLCSKINDETERWNIVQKLTQMWELLLSCSRNQTIWNESTLFIYSISNLLVNRSDKEDIFDFLVFNISSVFDKKRFYSFSSLTLAVDSLRNIRYLLIEKSIEGKFVSQLIGLLGYFLSLPEAVSQHSYFGIELFRQSVSREKMSIETSKTIQSIFSAIHDIIFDSCSQLIEQNRVVFWSLFIKSIIMNTRNLSNSMSMSQSIDEVGSRLEENQVDFGASFDAIDNIKTSSNDLNDIPSKLSHGQCTEWFPKTVQEFLLEYRNHVEKQIENAENCKIEIKIFLIECLDELLSKNRDSNHTNLEKAKSILQLSLEKKLGFSRIPTFLCLFMDELVNIGYSAVSFTIEGKYVSEMRIASLKYLSHLIQYFQNTHDPDANSEELFEDEADHGIGNESSSTKLLLMQYNSQLTSAARTSLLPFPQNPNVARFAGLLVFDLICVGIIHDMGTIKKLLKGFFCIKSPLDTGSQKDLLRTEQFISYNTESNLQRMSIFILSNFFSRFGFLKSNDVASLLISQRTRPDLQNVIITMLQGQMKNFSLHLEFLASDLIRLIHSVNYLRDNSLKDCENSTGLSFYETNPEFKRNEDEICLLRGLHLHKVTVDNFESLFSNFLPIFPSAMTSYLMSPGFNEDFSISLFSFHLNLLVNLFSRFKVSASSNVKDANSFDIIFDKAVNINEYIQSCLRNLFLLIKNHSTIEKMGRKKVVDFLVYLISSFGSVLFIQKSSFAKIPLHSLMLLFEVIESMYTDLMFQKPENIGLNWPEFKKISQSIQSFLLHILVTIFPQIGEFDENNGFVFQSPSEVYFAFDEESIESLSIFSLNFLSSALNVALVPHVFASTTEPNNNALFRVALGLVFQSIARCLALNLDLKSIQFIELLKSTFAQDHMQANANSYSVLILSELLFFSQKSQTLCLTASNQYLKDGLKIVFEVSFSLWAFLRIKTSATENQKCNDDEFQLLGELLCSNARDVSQQGQLLTIIETLSYVLLKFYDEIEPDYKFKAFSIILTLLSIKSIGEAHVLALSKLLYAFFVKSRNIQLLHLLLGQLCEHLDAKKETIASTVSIELGSIIARLAQLDPENFKAIIQPFSDNHKRILQQTMAMSLRKT